MSNLGKSILNKCVFKFDKIMNITLILYIYIGNQLLTFIHTLIFHFVLLHDAGVDPGFVYIS